MTLMQTVATMSVLSLATPIYAGQKIEYKIGENSFEGYFSKPTKNKSNGLVIIIHDWDGLTDYEVKRADMLADQGYEAFAIDLYGKGNRPTETKMKKAETAKLYDDRDTMRSRILAGLEEGRRQTSRDDAVVMGYCFGGAAVLELARSGQGKNIKGYASFHGGLTTPKGQSYKDSAPIFIAHGGADSGIPMSQVAQLSEELEKAGITYDLEVYSGAPHGFTEFGSKAYREHADKKSWSSFLNFLELRL